LIVQLQIFWGTIESIEVEITERRGEYNNNNMRGSTLLFHSLEALDPVSFDRVEDIIEEALEPELTYTDILIPDSHCYINGKSNSQVTPDSVTDKLKRSSSSDNRQEPSAEQLLDLFQSDLSSSFGSPLTKSNYFVRQSQFKENQLNDYSYENRRGSSGSVSSTSSGHSSTGSVDSSNTTTKTSSNSSIASGGGGAIGKKNIMSFHNHDGRKTFTSFGGSTAGMPLSKLRSESSRSGGGNHSHSFSQGNSLNNDQSSRNSESGFSKFFSGLKSSNNKSDKNRFDVNNLPPQLKNELKRIYVY